MASDLIPALDLGRREVSELACHDEAAEAELACRNACHAAAVSVYHNVCRAVLGRDDAVEAAELACHNACHDEAAVAAANACDAYASCSS